MHTEIAFSYASKLQYMDSPGVYTGHQDHIKPWNIIHVHYSGIWGENTHFERCWEKHNSIRSDVTNPNVHKEQAGVRMSELVWMGTSW